MAQLIKTGVFNLYRASDSKPDSQANKRGFLFYLFQYTQMWYFESQF